VFAKMDGTLGNSQYFCLLFEIKAL
jgi:hypothetical protein